MKIRLSQETIFEATHKKYKETRRMIASALGMKEATVAAYLSKNEINGPLTTEAVLIILEEELNKDRVRLLEVIES